MSPLADILHSISQYCQPQPVSFEHVPFSEPPWFWTILLTVLEYRHPPPRCVLTYRKSEGALLFMKALISSRGLYLHDLIIFQNPTSKNYPLGIRAQRINFLEDTSIQSIRIFFIFSNFPWTPPKWLRACSFIFASLICLFWTLIQTVPESRISWEISLH